MKNKTTFLQFCIELAGFHFYFKGKEIFKYKLYAKGFTSAEVFEKFERRLRDE